MKLAFIYFTYTKDIDILNLSLEAFDDNDMSDVYILDDANNPLPYIPGKVIKDNYKQTSFKRNNNLNGIECLDGMIQEYNRIRSIKNYDWVVKVDSDTFINDFDILRSIDAAKYNQFGTSNRYFYKIRNDIAVQYGCLHGISKHGLDNLNYEFYTNITAYQQDDQYERFAEDYMTSRMYSLDRNELTYDLANIYNNPIIKKETGIYFDFKMPSYPKFIPNIPLRLLTTYCAITFKQTFGTNNYTKHQDAYLKIAKNRMEKYVELIHSNL